MELVLHHTKRITGSFFKKIIRYWYISLIVIAVIGFFIYRSQSAKAKKPETTYTVKLETLKDILALSGKIDAEEKVSLHFQSGGRVSWVGVKEGDYVKKYQGIASLDTRQLQKSLDKYLNTYSKERRDFEQTNDDNETKAIALSEALRDEAKRTLENAQFDLNNSVIDVELQTIAKEYSYLYTPIEGIVTHAAVPAAGMNINLTDTFDVVNPETIYFAISADQTEVVKLTKGLEGTITLDAYPDEKVYGVIESIGYTPIEGETGTVYEVKLNLDGNEKTRYRLGMTGDVEFILRTIPNSVAVPVEYILDENDKQYVYKNVNGKKEKVEVTTTDEYDGLVRVTKGLSEGDVIYEITK